MGEPDKRLIDSVIEFTTPAEFKALPVAPIEGSAIRRRIFLSRAVLETTNDTAFEEILAATSATEETQAADTAMLGSRGKSRRHQNCQSDTTKLHQRRFVKRLSTTANLGPRLNKSIAPLLRGFVFTMLP